MSITLQERFTGCLLGLAVGDALGGRFEAQSAEGIRARVPTPGALVDCPQDEIRYTDDTQMAIGVAECLIAHGRTIEERLCEVFVANYLPSRGYGDAGLSGGVTAVLRDAVGTCHAVRPVARFSGKF